MSELWEASLAFPTVVFTIALGIVLVYWLFVLLGTLDLDLLGHGGGHDVGDASGGHDAGGDAGDGGHDGQDHDTDGDGDNSGSGPWRGLGLSAVPLTISISAIVLVCWVGSVLVTSYLLADAAAWLRGLVLPGMLIVALPIAAVLVRPLAPVFRIKEGTTRADLVGRLCTINTGHVDATFGDATVKEGGDVLIIQVRCDAGKLVRGDKALIIEFDLERQAFLVEPSADMLPTSKVKE